MIRSKLKSRFGRITQMAFFWAALALLLHLVPGGVKPGRAQSSRKDDIVFNSRGVPLAGASIRVCSMPASGQPCAPLAQIYSDSALTQALANPTATDGLGNYFFYATPGKYMIEVSGPGITTKQIPNVILPSDPSSPVFTGPISAFSLNLSGNLTVNGSTTVLGNLASGTLNLTNQSTPPGTSSSGSVNLYTKSSDKKLYYKDETGTETGYFDIRAFGGTVNGGSATCSITAASTTLTCTAVNDFASKDQIAGSSLGHGIVIYKAGASPTITTPGTPTVTPGGLFNGATTWNYKVIAEDYTGGLTVASAAGTTTVGQATLGVNSFTITNGARVSGVTTYTTSSNHNLGAGSEVLICQFGGGSCPASFFDNFNGKKVVVSVPTATTFTVNDGNMPDANESPGSGQGNVAACNTLTFGASTYSGVGTLRYWIYRSQGAGAYSLQGVAVGLDPFWVDCGGTAAIAPAYVPSTPPVATQAGYLTSTVNSGGGSTTMVLADAALTTVTNATTVHDNSKAVIAAGNAAGLQNGGTIYFASVPDSGLSNYNFRATTDLRAISSPYVTLLLNGNVGLDNPWILRTSLTIQGMNKRNSSFMYPGGALIGGNAQPLIYTSTANSITLQNLFLHTLGVQQTALYTDNDNGGQGATGLIFRDIGVAAQNGNGFARPMVFKGGFDYLFRQINCDAQSGAMLLPRPCIEFTDSSTAVFNGTSQVPGRVVFESSYIENSGIQVDTIPNGSSGSGNGFRFNGFLAETLMNPFLRIGPGGIATTDFNLIDVVDSDRQSGTGTPVVDATGSQTAGITINGGLVSLTAGSTQPMLISGYSGTNLSGLHVSSGNLGNTPWFDAGQNDIQVNNQPFAIYGTGHFTYAMPTPTAPTSCVVSAGGAVPLGQHTYSLTAVDADNNETLLGPAAVVTTTTGNQTVTCNLPARANGSSGFNLYRDSFKANPSGGTCGTVQLTGGSFTDSLSFGCGASNPSVNSAGSTLLSTNGLSTYKLRVGAGATGLTGTAGAGPNIQSSSGSMANPGHIVSTRSDGSIIDGGVALPNSDSFNRANNPLTTNAPNWTLVTGAFQINNNSVGGNGSGQNYAVYNPVNFASDDQTVCATHIQSGTLASQSKTIIVRGSATALTAYRMDVKNGAVALDKDIAGTNTFLVGASPAVVSGDRACLNVTGTTLTGYINGIQVIQTTDASIASGYPGIWAFNQYNLNSANLQWDDFAASPGGVSLSQAQTWSQLQTFSPGIVIGSETLSASPRGPLNIFLPGALTSTWTAESWTLDKAITVTRMQAQAKTAPAGCTTNAIVRVSDGTTAINLTISAAANDSGVLSQNYAAGATLTVTVQTAAVGCTTSPADANAVVQYRMQ